MPQISTAISAGVCFSDRKQQVDVAVVADHLAGAGRAEQGAEGDPALDAAVVAHHAEDPLGHRGHRLDGAALAPGLEDPLGQAPLVDDDRVAEAVDELDAALAGAEGELLAEDLLLVDRDGHERGAVQARLEPLGPRHRHRVGAVLHRHGPAAPSVEVDVEGAVEATIEVEPVVVDAVHARLHRDSSPALPLAARCGQPGHYCTVKREETTAWSVVRRTWAPWLTSVLSNEPRPKIQSTRIAFGRLARRAPGVAAHGRVQVGRAGDPAERLGVLVEVTGDQHRQAVAAELLDHLLDDVHALVAVGLHLAGREVGVDPVDLAAGGLVAQPDERLWTRVLHERHLDGVAPDEGPLGVLPHHRLRRGDVAHRVAGVDREVTVGRHVERGDLVGLRLGEADQGGAALVDEVLGPLGPDPAGREVGAGATRCGVLAAEDVEGHHLGRHRSPAWSRVWHVRWSWADSRSPCGRSWPRSTS